MKKTFTNFKMEELVLQMGPLLRQRGKLGYAAARNYRTLTDALTEYQQFKDELICKYGEKEADGRFAITRDNPHRKEFMEELKVLGEIKQEVEVHMASMNEAMQVLTGEELLISDWMLEE